MQSLGPIIGVILAGGRAERMGGGDKCLRKVGGKTILARVIERVRPQVDDLVLNANGDPDRFAAFGLPVVADSVPGSAGPLAGILRGLEWAVATSNRPAFVLSVPADSPFLPHDLAGRLTDALLSEKAALAIASSQGQVYPIVGLWPIALHRNLRQALTQENVHKVEVWAHRFRAATADFPADPIDPFFNANTPDQLAEAERLAARDPAI